MRVRVTRIRTRVAARVELRRPAAIDQHVARFVDLLRKLLGLGMLFRVERELVGMMRNDKLAVCALDVIVGGAFGKAQYFECV